MNMTNSLNKHLILISQTDLVLPLTNHILNLLLIKLQLTLLKLLELLIHHTPPPVLSLLLYNVNLKLNLGYDPLHLLLTAHTAHHYPILPENTKPISKPSTILVVLHITVLI